MLEKMVHSPVGGNVRKRERGVREAGGALNLAERSWRRIFVSTICTGNAKKGNTDRREGERRGDSHRSYPKQKSHSIADSSDIFSVQTT